MSEVQQAAEAGNEAAEETGAEVAEQFAAADATASPEAAPPPSLDEIAARMGWVPQDKFKGPTEKWKPADQFILDGKDIQERTSRELKEMRQTLDTVAKTSGAIMAERLAQQRDELERRYAAAVERGDPQEARKLGSQIDRVEAQAEAVVRPAPQPAAETEAWVQRNAKVKADPVAWQRALQVCDAYARTYPKSSVSEQLAYTEQNMKREFPHLFDDKPAPSVSAPASRATGSQTRGGETAADLPKEARAIAKEMVDLGQIPNEDAYAKHYFANLKKGK